MKKILLFLFLFCFPFVLSAQERILFFDARAYVNLDGSVSITENITVNVEHKEIRRGIYRDIPLNAGEIVVENLKMDGYSHPYFEENINGGLRINFGDDRMISRGTHTYSLSYTVFEAIQPFSKYDEVYWNVTGNDWNWPIEYARAEVVLPKGIGVFEDKISVYTGARGAKGTDAIHKGLMFWITKPLPARHGLTVAVPFEKGYIEFSTSQKLRAFWGNNYLLISWCVFGLMCIYAFWAWNRVGRDPASRVVRRFDPPKGVSPALARYLFNMGYDVKTFATALTSLTMKGALSIKQDSWDYFTITKKEYPAETLCAEESLVYHALIEERTVTGQEDRFLKSISDALKENLDVQNKGKFFSTNVNWVLPLYAMMALLCFGFYKIDPINVFPIFMVVFCLSFFSERGQSFRSWITAIILLFCLLLLLPMFKSLSYFYGAFIVLVFVFSKLIRAYSPYGREVMNDIEGFKEYLSIGEAGRVEASTPTDPEKIFCDYLPYALALGVENKWIDSFENVLSKSQIQKALSEHGLYSTISIGSALSCMTSSVGRSSSSHSSGSGGGGRSGGGFGGGGGGGR